MKIREPLLFSFISKLLQKAAVKKFWKYTGCSNWFV